MLKGHMGKQRAVLFLMVGYPGAGKTTASQIISDLTGAVHIWADYERKAMFGTPTYSAAESRKLYDHLNKSTELLLADGQSVIFDTNFGKRKDRDKLREIAEAYHAETKLAWLRVDKVVAKHRATSLAHEQSTRLLGDMPHAKFEKLTDDLEPPQKDENPILLDGTKITPEYVSAQLTLPKARKAAGFLRFAAKKISSKK